MCVLHAAASLVFWSPSIHHAAQKKVFPFLQHISKFLFSIYNGSRTFWQSATQTISAKVAMDSRHFVFYHPGFSADQYQQEQRKVGDGEFVIQIYVYTFCVQNNI